MSMCRCPRVDESSKRRQLQYQCGLSTAFLAFHYFVNNMESHIISTRPKSSAIDLEEYTWKNFHPHTILFFIHHLDVLLVPNPNDADSMLLYNDENITTYITQDSCSVNQYVNTMNLSKDIQLPTQDFSS
jgi:hypothetical protein